MKTIYTLVFFVFALAGFSQAPHNINYQGVARNSLQQPLANKLLGLKFQIFEASGTTPVFTEAGTVTSNGLGIFTWNIGSVSPLSIVDWRNGPIELQVSMDTTGGTSYLPIGGKQTMVSVPFALNARYASTIPPTTMSFTNGILTVNGVSQIIGGGGSTPTLNINGTTLAGTSLGLIGGNSVTVPSPTITGSGGTTVTPGANGYDINTPSVTVRPLLDPGLFVPGNILGLAQVVGTYPNYSIAVTPTLSYSQITGSLTISSNSSYPPLASSPGYSYNYYITPNISRQGNLLYVGPLSNQVDMNPIAPWRWNQTANTVTLAAAVSATQAVGINTSTPVCALDVVGYTKLGATAPKIQMEKITGVTAAANGTAPFPLPSYIAQSKILSITVMVDISSGSNFDWIHPNYTILPGVQFTWRVTTGIIFVENTSGNSGNIAGKPLRILITYEQ